MFGLVVCTTRITPSFVNKTVSKRIHMKNKNKLKNQTIAKNFFNFNLYHSCHKKTPVGFSVAIDVCLKYSELFIFSFLKFNFLLLYCVIVLKVSLTRHGDAQTHALPNIEFLQDFLIFDESYKKITFKKMTVFKVN